HRRTWPVEGAAAGRSLRARTGGALALCPVLPRYRPDRVRLGLLSPGPEQRPPGLGPAADDGGLHVAVRRPPGRAPGANGRPDAARPAPGGGVRQRGLLALDGDAGEGRPPFLLCRAILAAAGDPAAGA